MTQTKYNPAFWPNTARLVSPLSPPAQTGRYNAVVQSWSGVEWSGVCLGWQFNNLCIKWRDKTGLVSGTQWGQEGGQRFTVLVSHQADKQTESLCCWQLRERRGRRDTISAIWSQYVPDCSYCLETRTLHSRPTLKLQLWPAEARQTQPVLLCQCLPGQGWGKITHVASGRVESGHHTARAKTTCFHHHHHHLHLHHATLHLLPVVVSHVSALLCPVHHHLSPLSNTEPSPLQTPASSWAASSHQREWSQQLVAIDICTTVQDRACQANYLPSSF